MLRMTNGFHVVLSYVVLGAIINGSHSWQHFSWVSIGLFGVYETAEMINLGRHFYWLVMTCQLQVIFSVIVMAYSNCDVFEDAYRKSGPILYTIGNFSMHYLPSLIMKKQATPEHIHCGNEKCVQQVGLAFGFYLVWYFFEDPILVYGCTLPSVFGVFGALAIDVCVLVVSLLSQRHNKPLHQNHDVFGSYAILD